MACHIIEKEQMCLRRHLSLEYMYNKAMTYLYSFTSTLSSGRKWSRPICVMFSFFIALWSEQNNNCTVYVIIVIDNIKNASQITQPIFYFYILITIQGTLSKFCRSVHSCLKLLYKNCRLRLLLCLHILVVHTAVPPKMHLPDVYTNCPYLVMLARLGLINGQSGSAMSTVYQILCLQVLTIKVSFKIKLNKRNATFKQSG